MLAKHIKVRNPIWLIKLNAKRLMKKRTAYSVACIFAQNDVKNSHFGIALTYLVDLSDRIKRVSREFPNQPILLDEKDLDYIFLDISEENVNDYIRNYKEIFEEREEMRRYLLL
jgi:hypothetical protein